MKKFLWLLMMMSIYLGVNAQTYSNQVTVSDSRTLAIVKGGLNILGSFTPPRGDTNYIATQSGQLLVKISDGNLYISTGLLLSWQKHWSLVTGGGGGGFPWGSIPGNISAQGDLQTEFNTKQNVLPIGLASQYWGADGSLITFPAIPAQVSITSPNGSISVAGVYPNITIQNSITRLGQLTNDVGFITSIPTIVVSGDATGSGTTSIPLVFPNIISPGSCTNCSVTFNSKGQPTAFSSGTGSNLITSVFTRTGAVTANTGDYTAAQVTNAVSTIGSYTNPSWLVSIPWTKITTPPTTIAGYGITDNLVNTFNTRTGAVTLSSSDVTTALTFTPVTNARTITINGVTFDLSANRTYTVTGTGTLSRISPIDSLGGTANGLQISGGNIVPSSATATTAGMVTAAYWKTLDSIVNRTIINRIAFTHAGVGLWTGWTSPRGDSLYSKDIQPGVWSTITAQSDSSLKLGVDSAAARTYFNNYYLPLHTNLTVNGTPYDLSTNPSITISGGVSDTANTTTAGLLSAYTYNKTLHPLIIRNDSSGVRDSVFHSNGDTLFAKSFVFGYGITNNYTQIANYHRIDTSLISTKAFGQSLFDILNVTKEPVISGTGYPVFSGPSITFQTASQLTASLSVFGTSVIGLVPAPNTSSGTHFLSDVGWTTLPSFSIFTANGISNGTSPDSIYWGGPLNQPTTISDPAANWLTFNGTYTTAANNQWYWNINPSITLRGTASDVNTGMLIAPAFTLGANTQTVSALDINPTMNAGSFTGGALFALRVGGDIVPLANGVTKLGGVNNWAEVDAHALKSNGALTIVNSGSNSLNLQSGWGSTLSLGATGIAIAGTGGSLSVAGSIQNAGLTSGLTSDSIVTEDGGGTFHREALSDLMTTINYVKSFNSRNGVITLSSSDVTTALGFTPVAGSTSTFTPAVAAVSGFSGSPVFTPTNFTYTRIGNQVHVSGIVIFSTQPSGGTTYQISVTPPFAFTFSTAVFSGTATPGGSVLGETTGPMQVNNNSGNGLPVLVMLSGANAGNGNAIRVSYDYIVQ